jgi:hypothetical protein
MTHHPLLSGTFPGLENSPLLVSAEQATIPKPKLDAK